MMIRQTSDVTEEYIMQNMRLIGGDEYWLLYEDDEGRAWAVPTEKAELASRYARIDFARIPKSMQGVTLESINTDLYREDMRGKVMMVRSFINNFNPNDGKSLYIWSHALGSGKTMTACAIANALIANWDVMFTTSGDMFSRIRATFDKKDGSSDKLISKLKECDLLILDDIGVEKMSAWTDETMYSLINDRYLSNKPAVYTSNLAPDELGYNRRIIDRIKANCDIIHWPEEGVREVLGNLGRKQRGESSGSRPI